MGSPSDILFQTSRFNLSEVQPHFINPNCFGEDLATWLRDEYAARGLQAGQPGQEDWGWYLDVTYQNNVYFVGVGGNAEESTEHANLDRNWGEWRVMIERHRTVWERFKRIGRTTERDPADDALVALTQAILAAEPSFHSIRLE